MRIVISHPTQIAHDAQAAGGGILKMQEPEAYEKPPSSLVSPRDAIFILTNQEQQRLELVRAPALAGGLQLTIAGQTLS